MVFQCPQAITANDSAAAGYPTWWYLFNASFPNTQAIPNLAAYHSSEIPIVFSTYVQTGVTAQEYALSNYMRVLGLDLPKIQWKDQAGMP
jgi:carboxylesterase type B